MLLTLPVGVAKLKALNVLLITSDNDVGIAIDTVDIAVMELIGDVFIIDDDNVVVVAIATIELILDVVVITDDDIEGPTKIVELVVTMRISLTIPDPQIFPAVTVTL